MLSRPKRLEASRRTLVRSLGASLDVVFCKKTRLETIPSSENAKVQVKIMFSALERTRVSVYSVAEYMHEKHGDSGQVNR